VNPPRPAATPPAEGISQGGIRVYSRALAVEWEVEMKKSMKNLSLPISMDDVLRGKSVG